MRRWTECAYPHASALIESLHNMLPSPRSIQESGNPVSLPSTSVRIPTPSGLRDSKPELSQNNNGYRDELRPSQFRGGVWLCLSHG
jgi:hypothetical protein